MGRLGTECKVSSRVPKAAIDCGKLLGGGVSGRGAEDEYLGLSGCR